MKSGRLGARNCVHDVCTLPNSLSGGELASVYLVAAVGREVKRNNVNNKNNNKSIECMYFGGRISENILLII